MPTPTNMPMTSTTSFPSYWEQAKQTLSSADPTLGTMIHNYHGEGLQSRGHAFHTLARSIVGQQISVKAADAVWRKFEAVAMQGGNLNPAYVMSLADEQLRACGLSGQKVAYMQALSEHFHTQDIHSEDYWLAKADADIIAELTRIKGIGVWTAEMFLIFHLMRPDVFPLGDIGLLKAIEKHYAISAKDKKAISAHAEQWRPYRSVATWYLWRSLDPVVVAY